MVAEKFPDDPWESDLVFTRADLRDVIPHDKDPVVISVVTAGRKVLWVLVDQGSSADVMFWSTFNKLQLSPDLLRPYTGCLYGFADNPVEVRGYLELWTTFTDGATSCTEGIRYLVVNANSAYNILLGRPALNRLRVVSSMRHMKMKLASSGKGGRQRTVIQETLKTPRKFVADNRVDVHHISTARGKPRNHRSLSQDIARAPCISTYATLPEEEKGVQVCALEEGDTWMTPYRRYLEDGILPAEPEEGKKIKRNAARYTLVDGILFRHRFTHPILTCVSGDECTRIMAELHEGICGSHVGERSLASKVIRAGFFWPIVREDCVPVSYTHLTLPTNREV